MVDGPALRRGHEPGARISRNARRRPVERRDERVLGQILGNANVATIRASPAMRRGDRFAGPRNGLLCSVTMPPDQTMSTQPGQNAFPVCVTAFRLRTKRSAVPAVALRRRKPWRRRVRRTLKVRLKSAMARTRPFRYSRLIREAS